MRGLFLGGVAADCSKGLLMETGSASTGLRAGTGTKGPENSAMSFNNSSLSARFVVGQGLEAQSLGGITLSLGAWGAGRDSRTCSGGGVGGMAGTGGSASWGRRTAPKDIWLFATVFWSDDGGNVIL